MKPVFRDALNAPAVLSRRNLLAVFPACAASCLGCAGAAPCSAQPEPPPAPHTWTEKADLTWEQIFRFAFQKEYIPTMKALSARIGNEKFIEMLKEIVSQRASAGMAGRKSPARDLSSWSANMKSMPPLYQHALAAEILEDTPRVFEFRVSRCLWAKTFREENAADLGYAVVCYPDYAVAAAYNPKLKLTRTKTLMQGDDHCNLRYVMES